MAQNAPLRVATHAARVPPSTTSILHVLRRLPLPRPVKGDGGTATSGEVAHELDVGILVQIGVGMEFAGDKVLYFARRRGVDICEAGDLGLDGWVYLGNTIRGLGDARLGLADDKGERKDELLVATQFKDKVGRAARDGGLEILQEPMSAVGLRCDSGHNARVRTCTNSIGVLSPAGREATILEAGNALGAMLTVFRVRGFVTTIEDMDTARRQNGQRMSVRTCACTCRQHFGGKGDGARKGGTHVGSGLSNRERPHRRAYC